MDVKSAQKMIDDSLHGAADLWSLETLRATTILVDNGRYSRNLVKVLSLWVMEGAEKRTLKSSGWQSHPTVMMDVTAKVGLVRLFQEHQDALDYVTDALIEGVEEAPRHRYRAMLDAFTTIVPERALPTTREAVSRVLKTTKGLPTPYRDQLRDFRRQLPGGSAFERLFG